MPDIWHDMQAKIDSLAQRGLLRRERVIDSACGPTVEFAGRRVVCLCSNDYLNLANDPAVKAAAIAAVAQWGVGAGASRLVSGTSRPHEMLERAIAAFEHAPAAVVTSTGWMANHAAVCALAGRGDLILCDKLNHASIIDAAIAAGARLRTYPHRDAARAERLLESRRAEHKRCLIVTDSLFSMDGDLAPLEELVELKRRFDAQLLVDEAHATGVLGTGGCGGAKLAGVSGLIDATVGTLSKALGAMGGFVAGPAALIDTIRNAARPYVYTTALPPAICAAAMAALDIVVKEPNRRAHLLALADVLRRGLHDEGLSAGDSAAQIVPIILGEAAHATEASCRLLEAGFLIPAIRPPTVPPNTSRLRISLSAGHTLRDVEAVIEALRQAVA